MNINMWNNRFSCHSTSDYKFLYYLSFALREQDSSGGIVMGYGLDSWSLIPSRGKTFFFSPIAFRQALGPIQPPIQCVKVKVKLAMSFIN
jgi:hypothetical protein